MSKLPAEWNLASIEDAMEAIIDYRGKTPTKTTSGIPLITAKIIDNGRIAEPTEFISENTYLDWMKRGFPKQGDVLITTEAPLGEVAQLQHERVALAQRVILLRGQSDVVDNSYLKWVLQSPLVQDQLRARSTGSTVLGIKQSELRKVKFPYPPIAEQRRIAAILDRADAVRRKRQHAIALTEELLRSAFLEMFGDPVTNPKGWSSGTILDVVTNPKTDVRCGPFGTQLKAEEIVSEGIPLFGIENVKGGRFQILTTKYLTPSKAKELAAFDIQKNDVLVTRMGTVGHACVVSQEIGEARFSYHLFRVRPNPSKCLPGFLASTITRSGTFLSQLERLAHGAIMAGLKTADLKEVCFLIPPVELQKQYLEIVHQTENLLENQKQRLINDANLFNSLLQRAFRGEL